MSPESEDLEYAAVFIKENGLTEGGRLEFQK